MSRPWQYPIFLIQHGQGYASIVDSSRDASVNQSLVVCRREEDALVFMTQCEILGVPRELRNDREFGWLLRSLRPPVVDVIFDPRARLDEASADTWRIGVRELLDEYLVADNSPWNYPVYVVAQEDGFVSIEGQDSEGRAVTAIGFFASQQRIDTYFEAAGETGTPCAIADLEEARAFLTSMSSRAAAVAWNPTVVDGQRVAKRCFPIATLLEKYLVVADNDLPPRRDSAD